MRLKPRFTLRDLFWLTLVIALAFAWWLDHGRLDSQVEHYQRLMFYSGVPDPQTATAR